MITNELLDKTEILKDLSPEQKDAITTLSQNDENTVIAAKTRAIYDGIDNDVVTATGLQKEAREKTYDFLKRAFGDLKKVAEEKGKGMEEFTKQIETLKAAKTALEAKIKEGGNAKFQQQLEDKNNRISNLESQIKTSLIDFEKRLLEKEDENIGLQIGFQFDQALVGKKFKQGIPEVAINATLKAAKTKVLSKGNPEFSKDENGKKIVVFRDDEGMLIKNPENLQKPFTATELYLSELSEILEEKRMQNGAGTQNGKNRDSTMSINIGEAKTKVEAEKAISADLSAKGIAKTSPDYQKAFNAAWNDNNVSSLPLR